MSDAMNATPVTSPVASPCRSQCKLDEDQFCIGCGRSVDDIRQWKTMADDERLACKARAALRRNEHTCQNSPTKPAPGPTPTPQTGPISA